MTSEGMHWTALAKAKELDDGKMKVYIPEASDFNSDACEKSRRCDAPYLYKRVKGNFQVWLRVSGKFRHLSDQSGILIKGSKSTYIRCSIEVQKDIYSSRNTERCVTVEAVNNGIGDSSNVSLLNQKAKEYWLSVKRCGNVMTAYYSHDGTEFKPICIESLDIEEHVSVGIYGASPRGHGFYVTFDDFEIKETNDNEAVENSGKIREGTPCTEELPAKENEIFETVLEAKVSPNAEETHSTEDCKQRKSITSCHTDHTDELSESSLDDQLSPQHSCMRRVSARLLQNFVEVDQSPNDIVIPDF